jgi:hypothetical protein
MLFSNEIHGMGVARFNISTMVMDFTIPCIVTTCWNLCKHESKALHFQFSHGKLIFIVGIYVHCVGEASTSYTPMYIHKSFCYSLHIFSILF